jgi:FHA domain-containing protein
MRSIDQLDAWITTKVRAWSSKISGTPRTTDLIEIRRDILNDVRDHIEPIGGGNLVFPYNTVAIHITAENDQQREMLAGAFGQDNDLEETISALLREARCAPPAGLHVAVSVEERQGPELTPRALHIDYSNAKTAAKERLRASRPDAKLTVLRGEADAMEYTINADRTNLGRLKEVVGDRDGLRRRNDVAFSENETTVSREHAFIRYELETGKFRIYDSISQRGTSVFRDGRRFVVPKGPTRGFQLRSGDEIHLGDARLRFEIQGV